MKRAAAQLLRYYATEEGVKERADRSVKLRGRPFGSGSKAATTGEPQAGVAEVQEFAANDDAPNYAPDEHNNSTMAGDDMDIASVSTLSDDEAYEQDLQQSFALDAQFGVEDTMIFDDVIAAEVPTTLESLTYGTEEGDDEDEAGGMGQYDALSDFEERFIKRKKTPKQQSDGNISEDNDLSSVDGEEDDEDLVDVDGDDGKDDEDQQDEQMSTAAGLSVDSERDISTVEDINAKDEHELRRYFQRRREMYMQKTNITGMDILARGSELLEQRRANALPKDDATPLHEGAEWTKGDWARMAIRLFTGSDDGTAILQFLKSTMPSGINFPVKEATNDRSLKSNLAAYSKSGAHKLYLEIEVCKMGCHVFGEGGRNKDETFCPKCKMPRYTLANGTSVPLETFHYKPLIPLLKELLEHKLFVKAITHRSVESLNEGVIGDLLHGTEIRRQLAMMELLFERHKRLQPLSYGARTIPINIILGEFWDGAQVHSTVISKFYPVFISLNNLPPSMRGVLGVGTFLLALDTVNTLATRNFIFQRCLLPELEHLANGFDVETTGGQQYFVQARMLCHNYDTKALETMFGVQASTAAAPCPVCGTIKGVYRRSLNKVYFPGHRALLPPHHYFRSLAQLGRELPINFFEADDKHFYTANTTVVDDYTQICHDTGRDYPLSLVDYAKKALSSPQCFVTPVAQAKEFLAVNKFYQYGTQNKFKNGPFACDDKLIDRVLPKMRFSHADLRTFTSRKVSHLATLRNAKAHHEAIYAAHAAGRSLDSVKAVRGSTGGVFYMTPMPYYNKPLQSNFDGFHAMLGFAKILQMNFSGDRPYSFPHAVKANCHVEHMDKPQGIPVSPMKILLRAQVRRRGIRTSKKADKRVKSKADWVFPAKLQDKCDVFVECLNLPVGVSSHFEVNKLPFARSGLLKGIGKLQLFAYVLPAFMSTTDVNVHEYNDAYRAYIEEVGQVFKKLLSPVFTVESITQLDLEVIETIVMYEGLLPDSEACFLIHEVVDLVDFIEKYGPLRCWWTLYGERAISKIKRFVPRGGRSYQITTVDKYVLSEESDMNKFYSSVDNLAPDRDFIQVDMVPGTNGTEYTISSKLACSRLYSNYSKRQMEIVEKRFILGIHQLKHFFECLILEVEDEFLTMAEGLEQALFASALYRVYYHFTAVVMDAYVAKRGKVMSKVKMHGSAFLRWLLSSACLVDVKARTKITSPVFGSVKANLDQGNVFCDFKDTIEAVQMIQVELYRIAVLQGVRMNSREWFCMEVATDFDGSPRNDFNNLKNNWHLKKHYSSWCTITPVITNERISPGECLLTRSVGTIVKRFTDHNTKNRVPDRETFYAQINIYMVLQLPTDSFLDRRAFASVTCRRAVQDQPRKISCTDSTSFEPRIAFVPIKDIRAIRYGVVAYHQADHGLPFASGKSMLFKEDNKNKFYAPGDKNTADHLIMCELDPNEHLHDVVRSSTFRMGLSVNPSVAKLRVTRDFYG